MRRSPTSIRLSMEEKQLLADVLKLEGPYISPSRLFVQLMFERKAKRDQENAALAKRVTRSRKAGQR